MQTQYGEYYTTSQVATLKSMIRKLHGKIILNDNASVISVRFQDGEILRCTNLWSAYHALEEELRYIRNEE